jgi:LysM repeat protein
MMKKLTTAALVALFIVALYVPPIHPQAQGSNLLVNPGMENPYTGQGLPTQTAPNGWRLWYSGPAVVSFPHTDQTQIHGGSAAWNINKGFEVFKAGGYQQVSGIRPGSLMRSSMYGLLYTCNNQATSCINGSGQRVSDRASGAYFKIGIDPSGGTDPNSSLIVWSNNAAGFDSWTAVGVDATACNSVVTVFLFATQSLPMALNNVYFDDASLVVQQESTTNGAVTCGSGNSGGGGTVATTAPPTQAFAPFVQKQPGEQPDGSIIHVMVAGDTLAAIAVAYGTTLDEIRRLNGFKPGEGGYLQIGTKIIVRGPTKPTDVPLPTVNPNATPTNIADQLATNPPLSSTQIAATNTGNVLIPTVTPAAVAQLNPVPSVPPSPGVQFVVGSAVLLIQVWLRFAAAG